MKDNKKLILKEFEKLKGQFVITESWKIEKLVAVGDDTEDYYYVTFNGRDLTWNTCVGRLIPLKGYLRKKDYDHLITIAKLNHYDQILSKEAFAINLDKYIAQYPENHKFLTEFCWEDLN